jgi:membrane protein DedA with SNARE-associated domain
MHGLLNLEFIARHTYSVLFVWVLLEQAGLPVPSIPILLASGAMASSGHVSLPAAIALAMLGSLIADYGWFELGRHKGMKVLNFLCKMSLEPDSCVRQTESAFAKQGLRTLVFAKFIPGLGTAAPPLAGVFRLPLGKFLLFDALGTFIWAGLFVGLGAIFEKQLEVVEGFIQRIGGSLFMGAAVLLALYVAWKFVKRELFIRELRMARIDVESVKRMMDRGEEMFIVDLRHAKQIEVEPYAIAGALRLSPDELAEKHDQIPRDRDVILYCT